MICRQSGCFSKARARALGNRKRATAQPRLPSPKACDAHMLHLLQCLHALRLFNAVCKSHQSSVCKSHQSSLLSQSSPCMDHSHAQLLGVWPLGLPVICHEWQLISCAYRILQEGKACSWGKPASSLIPFRDIEHRLTDLCSQQCTTDKL